MAQTQSTDYTANDPFPAESHEDALDRLTFIAQQQQEEVDRSIKLSRTNTMTSTEFTVGATDRANKILAFDGNGELSVTQELGTYKGTDATVTTEAYVVRDIIKSTTAAQLNNVYICVADAVVGDSLTDTDHFELLVDAVTASTSATNAANSASAASTSESNAATSESNAATSETNAATSASNASTSETNAATSATNASNSATSAASSATTATTKASEASTSATNAGTSESNASTSATNAATSATNASTSETNAATSATTATTQASAASTSASNAATSASNASTSETNAAASAAAAAASADTFDDTYLGSKSSDPSVDNDGDALNAGDLYFNTTSNTLKVYTGSAWQDAAIDSSGFVQTTGDTMTGNLLLPNGAVGTPSIGFASDTNTGIYRGGTDILKFVTAGTDAVTINASQDVSLAGSLNFADNEKAFFGASSDLQIYHDGSNSYIKEVGDGGLIVQASTSVSLQGTNTSNLATFLEGGAVSLYNSNAVKLATSATGIDVTGLVKTSNAYSVWLGANVLGSNGGLTSIGANPIVIGTDGTERMRIPISDSRSVLSIGDTAVYTGVISTTATNASLISMNSGGGSEIVLSHHDALSTSGLGNVTFNRGSAQLASMGSACDGATDSGNLKFWTTASGGSLTERMRIDSSGNVGIATSSPVNFGAGTAGLTINGSASHITWQNSGTNVAFAYNVGNNFLIGSEQAGSSIIFSSGGSERMRIDGSGNLLVGKTSSGIATAGIELRANDDVLITSNGSQALYLNRLSSDGSIVEFRKDGTVVGTIGNNSVYLYIGTPSVNTLLKFDNSKILPTNSSGTSRDDAIDLGASSARFNDIYATNGTIQTSDQNEKNTITDSDLGIDFIKRLTPKSYIFNDKTRTHYGLIAQDVETVLSDISKPTSGFAGFIKSDISEEQDGSEYRYGLRYTEFVAPLIQAVKEQQATIDALTARITALENGE
jgi:hypothetical protein